MAMPSKFRLRTGRRYGKNCTTFWTNIICKTEHGPVFRDIHDVWYTLFTNEPADIIAAALALKDDTLVATKKRMFRNINENSKEATVKSYLGMLSHGNAWKLRDKIHHIQYMRD